MEELYSDVTGRKSDLELEREAFASADAFIFSTRMLVNKVSAGERPYVICNGIYQPAKIRAKKGRMASFTLFTLGRLIREKGVLPRLQRRGRCWMRAMQCIF